MVTEITGAGFNFTGVSQAGAVAVRQVVAPFPLEASERQKDSALTGNVHVSSASQVAGVYSQLIVRQDELIQTAGALREFGKTLNQAEGLLGRMEEKLSAIVKMYPPYPVDNPERISLLNNFSGLRHQIDALTFPPPDQLDALKHVLAGEQDGEGIDNVNPLPLLDKSLWEIPVLDAERADDERVEQALEQVRSARSTLEAARNGMWEDVVRFTSEADNPVAITQAYETRELLADIPTDAGIGQAHDGLRLLNDESD